VSEENLRRSQTGGQYLWGRRPPVKRFEAELLKEDWTRVRPTWVKRMQSRRERRPIFVRTGAARRGRASEKVFHAHGGALEALKKSIVSGPTEGPLPKERRLGGSGATSQVNDLFEVTLQDTPAGVRLLWEMKKDRERGGTCGKAPTCWRTNLQRIRPADVVHVHALTERRPRSRAQDEVSLALFHQKESRVKAQSWCLLVMLGVTRSIYCRSAGDGPQLSQVAGGKCQPLSPMKALVCYLRASVTSFCYADGRATRPRRLSLRILSVVGRTMSALCSVISKASAFMG